MSDLPIVLAPSPPVWPLLGNLLDVQDEVPVQAFVRLGELYGPFYRLRLLGEERYIVTGYDVFNQLCDETRFYKIPQQSIIKGFKAQARGLLTAPSEKDPDWQQAHRILVSAFNPASITEMFDEMYDIASQMILKWARLPPETPVLLTDDFTRLTLDTLALCAMDYRFNSFYTDMLHPYVAAMRRTLQTAGQVSQIGTILRWALLPSYATGLRTDATFMASVCDDLVQHRRAHPTEKRDLLNAMVHGRDPKTGAGMRDALMGANIHTFLVAGHETSSGLLAFAFVQMLQHPRVLAKACEEVDRVLGGDTRLQPAHLSQLPYIEAVLRETLRLAPVAPAFARGVRPENKEERVTVSATTKDGAKVRFEVPRNTSIMCILPAVHRDPAVWGDDADEFCPERMLGERFNELPPNAWRAFGTGLRACMGRAFAWQETVLVTALVLRHFDLSFVDPTYTMAIEQQMTLRPKNAYVNVTLRSDMTPTQLMHHLVGDRASGSASVSGPGSGSGSRSGSGPSMSFAGSTPAFAGTATDTPDDSVTRPTLTILVGSNTGTCHTLAKTLAFEAGRHDFAAAIRDLDSAVGHLPSSPGSLVVVITATYEGQPPDNAACFVPWLKKLGENVSFADVRYAVFGCGHRDWATTFQIVPTQIDGLLAAHGATRVAERGVADAAARDMLGDFAQWTATVLWPAVDALQEKSPTVAEAPCPVPTLDLTVSSEQRAVRLQLQTMVWATVTDARRLTAPDQPEKRHITFRLPPGIVYTPGDYLAVLPRNSAAAVRRVLHRFGLTPDTVVTIRAHGHDETHIAAADTLPTNTSLLLADLLEGYVELGLPASRRDVAVLAQLATDTADRRALQALVDDADVFVAAVRQPRTSLLDLLEEYPAVPLSLASFLALLPPLRPRHYSIASAPSSSGDNECVLCYSVLDGPRWSAAVSGKDAPFHSVAGSYLRSLTVGDAALVAVRASNRAFRLPSDAAATPLVLVCAGSGLAPFRGFLEARSRLKEAGTVLAPALLFVGCRDPNGDRLYGAELDAWAAAGIVDVRYAFSQARDHPRTAGCRYVQDCLARAENRADFVRLWRAGAKVYTCGSGAVAAAITVAVRALVVAAVRADGDGEATDAETSDEATMAWLEAQGLSERIVTDVFT